MYIVLLIVTGFGGSVNGRENTFILFILFLI